MPVTKTELKNLKSLWSKKGRRDYRLYPAEGVRLLEEALRQRVFPEKIYYCETRLSARERNLLIKFESHRVISRALTEKQLEYLSQTQTPQGLVGVFSLPAIEPTELLLAGNRKLLLCENISDPGNLGTLIRSAAAFAFDLVVLSGETAEPYNHKVVRSSAGAIFGMKILKVALKVLLTLVKKKNIYIIGTSPSGVEDMDRLRGFLEKRRFLLAVGSEADGLSEALLANCDRVVRIAHGNQVESLNVAVAGSIVMKQVYDILNRE